MNFTTGGLTASKRTNYVVGMVMGVDDFEQEHNYLAARSSALARALAGSGITSGLQLSVSGNTVSVSPGSAIDGSGQMINVPTEQCAILADWVTEHQSELPASGQVVLYVILSYGEALTDPVAIPPGVNSSADSLTAPSRVQDSFELELTVQPPDQSEQLADQAFAAWMSQLTYVDGGKSTIQDLLTALAQAVAAESSPPAPGSLPPPPATLQIPIGKAAEYFRAALWEWTTQLAPQAQVASQAGGTAGAGSSAILVGTLTAQLESSGAGGPTLVPDSASVTPEGGPVVASIGLLGELISPALARPATVGQQVAAGRFEIERETADSSPHLETTFAENLAAHLVPRPGTSEEHARAEEARAHELYIRLRVHSGYNATHRYVLSALPLVEAHGARYAIEQVYDPPHHGVGSHEGPFMLRLSPVEGTARSLHVGFSVHVTDLGPPAREPRS